MKRITDIDVINRASKHPNRSTFARLDRYAYNLAKQQDMLEDMFPIERIPTVVPVKVRAPTIARRSMHVAPVDPIGSDDREEMDDGVIELYRNGKPTLGEVERARQYWLEISLEHFKYFTMRMNEHKQQQENSL